MAMSDWQTIENEVVSRLAGLSDGGGPLLATVAARGPGDRSAWAETIGRERLPAAYVVVTGRKGPERVSLTPGNPSISVVLATRSLRDQDDARLGADGQVGLWMLAERVAEALVHGDLAQAWRAELLEERPIGATNRAADALGMMVWEQVYAVSRPAVGTVPTFGGAALAGDAGFVEVEVGGLQRAGSAFSFPGIDGVFERHLGVRERPILWRGVLRAEDDVGLNALEEAIELEIREGTDKTLVDGFGRAFEACVLRSFTRRGPRHRDALTGEAVQPFEIQFAQLGA